MAGEYGTMENMKEDPECYEKITDVLWENLNMKVWSLFLLRLHMFCYLLVIFILCLLCAFVSGGTSPGYKSNSPPYFFCFHHTCFLGLETYV